MNRPIILGLALLLSAAGLATAEAAAAGITLDTNSAAVPKGWLRLPARELVLDFRQGPLDSGARREAGEVLNSILKVLVEAQYKVRLSPGFISDEIDYYRLNLNREGSEMARGVLACLEQARATGVLDWDAFKSIPIPSTNRMATACHLPWMAPPLNSKSVTLAGVNDTNLPCLHFSLGWVGRPATGAIQHARRPGGLPGETVLLTGEGTLWAYSAMMRFQMGGQTGFAKNYAVEEWRKSYVDALEYPVQKTTLRILQDLHTGLKPATQLPAEPTGKPRKRRGDAP
jgi:hypothetical protein